MMIKVFMKNMNFNSKVAIHLKILKVILHGYKEYIKTALRKTYLHTPQTHIQSKHQDGQSK